MAATLAQQYSLAYDTAFIQRVSIAIVAYAYTVESELSSVTSHAIRLTFANKVVQGSIIYAPQFAALIAAVDVSVGVAYASTIPASQANIADATIAADVAIGWNLVSGV